MAGKLGTKIKEPKKQWFSESSVDPTERDKSLSEDASFPLKKKRHLLERDKSS